MRQAHDRRLPRHSLRSTPAECSARRASPARCRRRALRSFSYRAASSSVNTRRRRAPSTASRRTGFRSRRICSPADRRAQPDRRLRDQTVGQAPDDGRRSDLTRRRPAGDRASREHPQVVASPARPAGGWTRRWMLRTSTHSGNRIWTHANRSMVRRSTTATTHPNTANHRGRMPRRTRDRRGGDRERARHPHRVDVEHQVGRLAAESPDFRRDAADPRCDSVAIRPPATAPATNSIATNSSPVPRNTVAKNRSSAAPIRSRIDAHEPQERKPGEGNKIERDAPQSSCATGHRARWGHRCGLRRDRDPQQHEGSAEQQCEHDARDGRGAWRAQRVPGDLDVLCHRKPPIAKSIPSVRHRECLNLIRSG